MAISAINSVNFTGKSVTKKGNEYDKTNVGKYAGMGVGAAAGTGYGIKIYNGLKKATSELNGIDVLEETFNTVKNNLDDAFVRAGAEPLEVAVEEFTQQGMKCAKRGFKAIPVILGLGGLITGLGLGAITDVIINHCRAKKADK